MVWAFLAGFVAVLIGVFLLRPRVARLFNNDFQGIKTEAIVGPIVALTVFLSAFVVAQATGSYQRASQDANAEASSVALLYENAGLLPDDRGTEIQASSVCYARSVERLEWPKLDQLEKPFTGIVKVEPTVIHDVAQDTAAKFRIAHPGVALPCDASGRPLH